jgi:tetratricopeptide (TPR) repeat protein
MMPLIASTGAKAAARGWWLVAILLSLSSLSCDYLRPRRKADEDPEKAERAREKRQEVVAEVPVAPLPSGVPLIEREGKDAWGYPKTYVDGAALRSLLHHARFTELTQYFEQFQREFEADPLKEFWTTRAAESFFSAEPELTPKLDAWVAAMPFSFAPYLARGAHRLAVAYAERGSSAAYKTPTTDFEAMHDSLLLARKDLERVLEMSPKMMAADRLMIDVGRLLSNRDLINASFIHGKQTCPGCLMIRTKYLVTLQPRWGGSLEAMEYMARTQLDPVNPRLALLRGSADAERSAIALSDERLDEALSLADAACSVGDHWEFFVQRARVHAKNKDYDKAMADIQRAIAQRPDLPGLLMERAEYRARTEDWLNAADDLLAFLRIDPTDAGARYWRPRIATGVSDVAWTAKQAGNQTRAAELIDLAQQLAPFDAKIRERKSQLVRGGRTLTPIPADPNDPAAALEAAARERPDDFRAHQQLDYAWANYGRYDKIIPMWNAYLERNPNDGQAYFERSGAYHNSGHNPEALADLDKACTLNVPTACAYAKRIRGAQ